MWTPKYLLGCMFVGSVRWEVVDGFAFLLLFRVGLSGAVSRQLRYHGLSRYRGTGHTKLLSGQTRGLSIPVSKVKGNPST